jgi:peptidyl-tRNA hydrolase
MANLRHTVLVRTDLGFSLGLLAAQVAHIHFEPFRQLAIDEKEVPQWQRDWLTAPYLFIHGVKNRESLEYYIKRADEVGVKVSTWKDTVEVRPSDTQKLVFPDIPVGISLGPDDSDKIRQVIGDLPLLS